MKTLRCDQCASTDLTRLAPGEYRCNHCKTTFHVAGEAAPPPPRPVVRPAAPAPPPTSTARKVLTVVVCLGLLVFAASLKSQRQARLREQRRQQALQRDIARSLEARMGNMRLNTGEITGGRLAGSSGPLGSGVGAGSGSRPTVGSESGVAPTPSKPSEYGSDAVEQEKIVSAKFVDAVALPDRVGNVYFVGIYRNTGEASIDRPRVEATLWDDKKQKVAVGSGYAAFNNLLPGEEVPVKILVQRPPAYTSVTYAVAPQPVRFGTTTRFKLVIEKPKLAPAPLSGYRLTGTVRNNDAAAVHFVHIVALLLGEDHSIVGMQDGFTAQRELSAGDYSPFSLNIVQTARPPKSFRLYHFAMAKTH